MLIGLLFSTATLVGGGRVPPPPPPAPKVVRVVEAKTVYRVKSPVRTVQVTPATRALFG